MSPEIVKQPRWYLRLEIDNFRLVAALRALPERPRGPVVLVDEAGRVVALNQLAQSRDLSIGMTMARALARCREMVVLHLDPEAERAAVRLLWKVAWQLTPQIELGAGALEGRATLELVRPDLEVLSARVPRLLKYLNRQGLPARAGLAATPEWAGFAAMTAERHGLKILHNQARVQALLAHLPLAVLDLLDERACRILEGWGIRSLGAVAALPRQALGERLGALGLRVWDILNGRGSCLLQAGTLSPDYRHSIDLEEAVFDLAALRYLLQQATEVLERQLEQAGKLARALSLDLWMEGGQNLRKRIRLPEATRRADLLERLLGNYLEQRQLAAPVMSLQVAVDAVDPLTRQAGLFERSVRNPWRLQETLDQLAGLLGSEAFGSPRRRATHRSDDYYLVALPADPDGMAAPVPDRLPGPPRMGPVLRCLRPPLKARVLFEQGRLFHLECPMVTGAVRAANGPYSANGDWAGAQPWGYVEWDVEIEGSGVFCLRRSGGDWQLIGAYD